ncbi:glycoside hydrolase family 79 protein [Lentinula aff. detonsa]|uniref:Glycoside hydrolase family 79 protein n=1 Tax=Lentinula aff. detonsa TaxID=2804958 RepID=A0AA38NIP3_9AGAR|nr:glycoside hydrolase family 79 protein [Lentinula aff. detonsa]
MKQLSPCITCLLGTLSYFLPRTTAQVLITPPTNPSEYASKPVANNFVSLSIAIHFFQDYTRTGSGGELPNIFSRNLLSSLKESTSFAPDIRIGGTSADRTTYVPSQNTTISQVSGANGIPLNVTLNQRWFQQCFDEANFPSGIKFIFDLPLMRNDSLAINNTIQGAQWALEAIGGDRLEAFEIGNEEDLYVGQGVVPATWTVVDYAARWKTFNSAIVQGALIPFGLDLTKKWFQGLAFSGLGANLAWTTETAFNANVNDNHTLKSVSLHNYPAGSAPWVNLGNTFMNHTAIVANLSQVKDDIAFLGSSPSTENIVFNLGETNIDFTNLNMDQFEGVLGSALWTIDYILYGASLNINRIYLHQGTTFGYAAWQPVATDNSQPKVRSPWYGLKFAAEAIGSHQGPIQIAPLDIVVSNNISAPLWNTTSDPNQGANTTVSMNTQDVPAQILTSEKISAYAVYESSLLVRIVLINFNEWNGTTPYPHPSVVFRINLPLKTGQSSSSHSVNTRTLTAPNGASADNDLTFGGIMWNYTTQGLPQRVESVPGTVQVQRSPRDGSITVRVGASEAMLINLGS